MRHITWYRLLAVGIVGVLLTSIVGRAQAPQAQAPRATVRELATIEGDILSTGYVPLPGGRVLIYTPRSVANDSAPYRPRVDESAFAYDIVTKRRTVLGTNMQPWSVSPQGDRLAFTRSSEDGTEMFVWTMPIDPQTGLATGQAQRVSLRPGSRANFSPDGRTLAINSGPRPDGTWDVTLVPATGGPERVVANYPRRGPVAWSNDGKFLYVEAGWSNQTSIERVPVAGGRSEPLFPRTAGTEHQVVGLSPDAQVAFFHENPDRFFYRTASGLEGEITVALPALDNGDGINMRFDAMRWTHVTQVRNQRVRVLDLATGQARDLLPANVQGSALAWSPDGRRFAALTGNLSHLDVTVVNADGSSPRLYPMPLHLEGWGRAPWVNPWSPDGRFLAFRTKDRPEVGWSPDDQRQIAVLDLSSGQARVLTSSSSYIGNWVWRSDGSGIRALKRTTPFGSPSRYSIVEIPLNGQERQLRDISAEFPNAVGGQFVFTSDRAVVVTVTDQNKTERFLVPLDGGAARRLQEPGIEPGSHIAGTLAAGNGLLILQSDAGAEARVVKIVSLAGDPTRTLRLPFTPAASGNGNTSTGYHILVQADGKQIITVNKATGESVYKLYLVPLDGSAPHPLGDMPRGPGGRFALSPDGKLLAYTSDGIPATKVFDVDFTPAVQAIIKR